MTEAYNKLDEKYRNQQDGVLDTEEVSRLRSAAAGYAYTEGSLAVLSNLRTNVSHVYFGIVGEKLGFTSESGYQKLDSIWEDKILARIHPDDRKLIDLQELVFFQKMSLKEQHEGVYLWHLERTMRMKDGRGHYQNVLHRVFYFTSHTGNGICYVLCLYNFVDELLEKARLVSITGDVHVLDTEECENLLSEREKGILMFIREGKASKEIADRLDISKHTVDRHRQNIIAKLQVSNSTEACHKAKLLGLID